MPARKPAQARSPASQLATFIARFSPDIAARARAILTRMRARLPGAVELVYDNYNGLVIGFGPTERPSEAPFSIVLYPRWITLFFLKGAHLPDPAQILLGYGSIVRRIVLERPETLDDPLVSALIDRALAAARWTPTKGRRRKLIIKTILAKQRPRRP